MLRSHDRWAARRHQRWNLVLAKLESTSKHQMPVKFTRKGDVFVLSVD